MGVNWTKEQQQVIELRNRNILVSAAAGSGKTAVLVERIIKMLTQENAPVDVDRLLIVTFTEAAAAEMKERIRTAIEKALEGRPQDLHLQRQATLIHSARITTIHSFCLSVIRDHFHVIDIDPGFRIAEEGELKLLKQDVLAELLETCYDKGDVSFLEFVERFSTGRDDKKIEELILQLYEYSRGYPEPEKWLAECAGAYHVDPEHVEDTVFVQRAKELAQQAAGDALQTIQRGLALCSTQDGPYMYRDMLESDFVMVDEFAESKTFQDMYEAAGQMKWMRLSPKKDENVSDGKKERIKQMRAEVKALMGDLCEQYFYDSPQVLIQDMADSYGTMQVLTELVQSFGVAFEEKKQSKNIIDFSDMEQFALRILTVNEGGVLVPSAVAGEYQEQFLEVMIDEYQDSNLIQEAILTSVSTVSCGRNNIFMVGDVKQSIYRFRLSRPELFMEKFDTYSVEESATQRIDLHKNFRSRSEVLGSANFIFGQIMTRELGGILYDQRAALYEGADYVPQTDHVGKSINETEILLVDTNPKQLQAEGEPTILEDTVRELEARAVARRIQELVQTGRVYDRETKEYRKARYRDIVILTRSVKGWSDTFSAILTEEGVPAYAGTREGYFETYEVSILLDYLRILDNLKQDLPLAAVLTSPIAGLGSEELAEIKTAYAELPFYEAAARYAGEGHHERVSHAFEQITAFRERVPYTPIHELLWHIIEETGYGVYIAAMPGGAQRVANVEMLVEKAAAFEGTSYKGLFNFVRYIEQLRKYDVDYGEANIADEQSDTVRIMSIHKSKGLEFPIVIVAGMGKRFNRQDVTGSMVIHPKWGIGIDAIDLERRTKAPTLLKKVIQKEVLLENLGEELRVLYVALTRAKEKLIMTGALSDPEEIMKKYAFIKEREEIPLPFGLLSGASTYFDWLLPSIMRVTLDIPMHYACVGLEELQKKHHVLAQADQLAKDTLLDWRKDQIFDTDLHTQLEEQLTYCYPYEKEGQLKLKFTVSELKKREGLSEEAGEELYSEPDVIPLLPRFLQGETMLQGASRGSAYHKVLELLDFRRSYDVETLEEQLISYIKSEKISKEMKECINIKDILMFLNCNVGKRMQCAAKMQMLKMEQPFVLGVDAKEIYDEELSKEVILVQGIIDVYFEEEGELVVLDYKTDSIHFANELKEKYHAQLEYYAKALERLTGKRVKEKLIYSFALQEEIEV